jgi:hypothetical protein
VESVIKNGFLMKNFIGLVKVGGRSLKLSILGSSNISLKTKVIARTQREG